jgi:hypothetical protein
VEEAVDRLLETRRNEGDGTVSKKHLKLRARRLRKIEQLRAEGYTPAQIRGRMNVRSGKKAWPKSEQEWFDQQMGDNA